MKVQSPRWQPLFLGSIFIQDLNLPLDRAQSLDAYTLLVALFSFFFFLPFVEEKQPVSRVDLYMWQHVDNVFIS